jgi:hypothetical protein
VVVGNDGTRFACWIEPVRDQRRWIILSEKQDQYIGPAYLGEPTIGQIHALVKEWWEMKGRLGHQHVTPETMLRRLRMDE